MVRCQVPWVFHPDLLTKFQIWSYGVIVNAMRGRVGDPGERKERAEHILDVAADLLLRFGYRRVTIDDVASQADIGKGTVYLHWRTREDLFRAVFEREALGAIKELLEVLRRDTGAWRPHRFARAYFLAIMSRPLLRAVVLADSVMLGKLAGPDSSARESRHRVMSHDYFAHLAQHGVLRSDLSTDAITFAFMVTLEGFIRAEPGDGPGLDLQARAELLARTVKSAFETGLELTAATETAIAAHVIDLVSHLVEGGRADLGQG
jgi:AcrR family transcriptional regulator